MSIKLMSQVWETAAVGGSELLVLLALADYANDEGTSIYPSMQSVAKKARLSVDQTRRIIHKLIADGAVELVELGGWSNGRNRPNEYRIILDGTGKVQGGVLADCKDGTRADTRGGTRAHARTVLAPMQDDPSFNHHIDPPLEAEVVEAKPLTPQQEMFGAICEALGWDHHVITEKNRAQVGQAIAVLTKANYTVADIRRFMTEVWFKDWRWEKKHQYPTLSILREEIGKTRSTIPSVAPPVEAKGIDGFRAMLARQGIEI